MERRKYKFYFLILSLAYCSCNKLVHVPEPINTTTTSETFATDALATSAINGIYSDMSWFGGNGGAYANGLLSIDGGLSADELIDYAGFNTFQSNLLLADDPIVNTNLWSAAYKNIYMANAVIEGLQSSTKVTAGTKTQLIGEAKFIRAFCHFYLVNLFGDVPLVTTTAWQTTSVATRTASAKVYEQIISDLIDAKKSLNADYSLSNDEHIRANKWAATALLARAYLYTKDWADAETQASEVIDSHVYSLLDDLNAVFLKNNNEAILQIQTIDISPWATTEGHSFIPPDDETSPNYYLTDQLLGAFETGDQRRTAWVDSTDYSGTIYYFPFKYKTRQGNSGDVLEYCTLLRFSEQYLIRAEARAQLNHLDIAIKDLDTIRNRAQLANLPPTLNQTEVLAAVAQERRIEFFAEWGHRWLDLKRTGQATQVLSAIKGSWTPDAQLYPIPSSEILSNSRLKQNNGY